MVRITISTTARFYASQADLVRSFVKQVIPVLRFREFKKLAQGHRARHR